MKISVVSPVYKAQDCLDELHRRLVVTLAKIIGDFEIIFVNDASPDRSWEKIKEICSKDKRVKGINFSRNFGDYCRIRLYSRRFSRGYGLRFARRSGGYRATI